MQERKEIQISLNDLLAAGVTLVVVGLVLAFSLEITDDIRDDLGEDSCASNGAAGFTGWNETYNVCANTSDLGHHSAVGLDAAVNGTSDVIAGIAKLPEKLEIIATVVVAAVIIGLLVRAFAFRM